MEVADYEKLFRSEFLKSAPLYSAAKKIKLPIEDIKTETLLYQGSLHEESRTVESIANYKVSPNAYDGFSEQWVRETTIELAREAGIVTDGLIRKEIGKSRDGADVHTVTNVVVTDVFEHEDGRRNLQFVMVQAPPSVAGPSSIIPGWVAYRFYFACAAIRQEYKASA